MGYDMNYLIDLDGTVYRGEVVIEQSKTFFNYLNHDGHRYVLMTNCPGHTPASLQAKLAGMGLFVEQRVILTSGQVTARYISEKTAIHRIYLIGGDSLAEELASYGIYHSEDDVDAVVVGFDQKFTYNKMKKAAYKIRQGAAFIATNPDLQIPDGHDMVPHTGAIAASIEAASGIKPLYIGKPGQPMLEQALDILGSEKSNCAIIGDNLKTDIQMGNANGVRTYLVLTGVTSPDEADHSHIKASCTFSHLGQIIAYDKNQAIK